jgi:tRNA dimethylallyltransferase
VLVRRVIVIAGATASGKTAASLALARMINCEIISADARQVFVGMDVGTAKPTPEEQSAVPHHLIDIRRPDERYNAAEYACDVHAVIDSLPSNVIPVMVGGSGMYINAALDGLSSLPTEVDADIRADVARELAERGRDAMYEELQRVDPEAAALYVDKNPRRIARALEVFRATGQPLTSFWKQQSREQRYDVLAVAIAHEREGLRARINARAELMWQAGLVGETQELINGGLDPSAQSLQTVGYREALAFLSGQITSQGALHDLKISTWQYAKRQLTWFMRDSRYSWISGEPDVIAESILTLVNERKWIAS